MKLASLALAFALAVLSTDLGAQKVWRIAYLSGSTLEADKLRFAAFRQGLSELGYAEGKTVVIEERYANGRPDRLAPLAQELVQRKVDIFVLYGSAAGVPAIRKASREIPIVFTVSADPIGEKVVTSLARPDGQVTGFSDLHSALVTKRLELLKELRPSASRIAVLGSALSPVNKLQLRDIRAAAPTFGVSILALEVSNPTDIEAAFKTMAAERSDGLMVLGDYLLAAHRTQVIDLATRGRLPTIVTTRESAQAGALLSYGADLPELWRRSAGYVDKILKGAKPSDLPVEQPTRFEVVINLKTAKTLGISISRSLLARADQVIE